jgi:hypothetical protein
MRLEGEKFEQMQIAAENSKLSAQGWADVKAYQAEQREAQRKSLAGRLAESHRKKELELQQHRMMLDSLHMDFALKRMDQIEMQEFKEVERTRSRQSIALRLASWKQDRMALEMERAKASYIQTEEAMALEQDAEELHAAKLALDMMNRHSTNAAAAAPVAASEEQK